MRVDDRVRKCVVFVGIENRNRFTPLGTGFIGAISVEGYDFAFIVTAAHVIDDVSGDAFHIRINRKDGGATTHRALKADVLRHNNLNNDVAVLPIILSPEDLDFMLFPLSREDLSKTREQVWDAGVGDEVCAVGLYTSHHGEAKNIPVVRIGNLAMLPEEPVRGPEKGYVDAYLIELKTIAGLSGSPVFVNVPTVQVREGQLNFMKGNDLFPVPLGVLLGYHVVESKEDQIQVAKFGRGEPGERAAGAGIDERNTGFGVVLPIERVMDIVEGDVITAAVRKAIDLQKAERTLKVSSALSAGTAPSSESTQWSPSAVTTQERPKER